MNKMKIYVASSWRNSKQNYVVEILRKFGYSVYDFKHPELGNNGFHWSEVDQNYQNWNGKQYIVGLNHPIAAYGFTIDMKALDECNVCILVLPCGKSSHLELGYAAGQGKKTFILLNKDIIPELMYKMATKVCVSISEVLDELEKIENEF